MKEVLAGPLALRPTPVQTNIVLPALHMSAPCCPKATLATVTSYAHKHTYASTVTEDRFSGKRASLKDQRRSQDNAFPIQVDHYERAFNGQRKSPRLIA